LDRNCCLKFKLATVVERYLENISMYSYATQTTEKTKDATKTNRPNNPLKTEKINSWQKKFQFVYV